MNRFIKYDKRQKQIAGEQKAKEVLKKPLKATKANQQNGS